jgi:ABC-2 type transport system permease protein
VWIAVLDGLLLLPLVFLRETLALESLGPLASAYDMFFNLGALAVPIGAVILAHGTIIGERQSGTVAWVLTKPVSHAAFVLAKFTGLALGLLTTAVLVPAAIAYAMLSVEAGGPVPLAPFVAAVGLLALNGGFYLALTLALGVFLRSRGAVLALGLVTLLGGDIVLGLVPATADLTPWLFGRMAPMVAQGGPLLSPWAVVVTGVWVVAFLVAALVRFGREEL